MAAPVKTFFLKCSGATLSILMREECETELNKYAGIGATVFLTSVLASISGGYALYATFRNPFVSALFGALWGLVVFNLDRYILTSIRLKKIDPQLPLAKRWQAKVSDLGITVPRVLLAVLFAIVIAKPLELRMFEREISVELDKENIEQQQKAEQNVQNSFTAIAGLQKENEGFREEIKKKEVQREQLREKMNAEREGKGFTGRIGDGPEFNRYKDQFEQLDREYQEILRANTEQIIANDRRLADLETQKEARAALARQNIEQRDGLVARISALSSLTKNAIANRGDYSYLLVDAFMMLLFFLVELSPILAKLFARFGPYDQIFEDTETMAMDSTTKKSQIRSRAQQQLSEELLRTMGEKAGAELHNAQIEIARHLIADWREKELREVKRAAARRAG